MLLYCRNSLVARRRANYLKYRWLSRSDFLLSNSSSSSLCSSMSGVGGSFNVSPSPSCEVTPASAASSSDGSSYSNASPCAL